MSKFKDLSKSKIFNPIDWFNFYGEFSIIFTGNRNANIINENEVLNLSATVREQELF